MSAPLGTEKTLRIVYTAIMTALVTVVTMAFQIYIPATQGYFNLGESIVYLTALLFGPAIAAFAGGVGSMMADIFTGYLHYAPWTLVNKGIEGYLAGWLYLQLKKLSPSGWKKFNLAIIGVTVVGILYLGITYFTGLAEIGGSPPFNWFFTATFPVWIWILVAVVFLIIAVYLGFFEDVMTGAAILALLIAGFWMVFGYFVYEQFVLGYGALAEVPFNIMQVLSGIVIAIPLSKLVKMRLGELFAEEDFFGEV
mgnify:CR=1 FL=1